MRRIVAISSVIVLVASTAAAQRVNVADGPRYPRNPRGRGIVGATTISDVVAAGHRVTLLCPHTPEANPVVLVAVDPAQPIDQGTTIAYQLAGAAMNVIVVAPPNHAASHADVLASVLDAVLAMPPEPSEPGCDRTSVIGAIGFGRAGDAVRELARRREAAGKPLALVVGVLEDVVESRSSPPPAIALRTTPAFAIAGTGTASPARYVVQGAKPCDVAWHGDRCSDSDPRLPPEERQLRWDLRAARMAAIYDRARELAAAYVAGDETARASAGMWATRIQVTGPDRSKERLRPKQNHAFFSAPWILGGAGARDSGGSFVVGIRPELVLARIITEESMFAQGEGHGLGVYGEATRMHGGTLLGGGLTYAAYFGGVAIAPSAGVYRRPLADPMPERGVTVGLFVGLRHSISTFDSLDLPIGFRLDARLSGSGDHAVMLAVQLDMMLGLLIAGGIGFLGGLGG